MKLFWHFSIIVTSACNCVDTFVITSSLTRLAIKTTLTTPWWHLKNISFKAVLVNRYSVTIKLSVVSYVKQLPKWHCSLAMSFFHERIWKNAVLTCLALVTSVSGWAIAMYLRLTLNTWTVVETIWSWTGIPCYWKDFGVVLESLQSNKKSADVE